MTLVLSFSRAEESIFVDWRGVNLPVRPAGRLARDVLKSLRADRRDVQRLASWMNRQQRGWTPSAEAAASLETARAQIAAWLDRRVSKMQWSPHFAELEGDGPTESITGPIAERMLADITWRGPALNPEKSESDFLGVRLPETAVLLSALYGMIRGTLTVCLTCRRLVVVALGSAKRAACPYCGARRRRGDRRAALEYRRAYDRLRKGPLRVTIDTTELWTIKTEHEHGQLTAAEAIRKYEELIPIGSRGRPRLRKSVTS